MWKNKLFSHFLELLNRIDHNAENQDLLKDNHHSNLLKYDYIIVNFRKKEKSEENENVIIETEKNLIHSKNNIVCNTKENFIINKVIF